MKKQLENLIETAMSAGATLREKAAGVGQSAVEGTLEAIERWLEEIPRIEGYGLKVSSFTFVMRLSPSLDIEMRGKQADFSAARLDHIVAQQKTASLSGMVFTAMRTAYRLHSKVALAPHEDVVVKMRLSLSPEISVIIGERSV
ncbi:MAG TPA: hypothetical protein PK971_05370 [Saprospiraceae bacterium]|nr:hypothetical protein [Saprospiraceae bacterium]HND87733.1 hypothetical protein [Saprospiraceae bacterium]